MKTYGDDYAFWVIDVHFSILSMFVAVSYLSFFCPEQITRCFFSMVCLLYSKVWFISHLVE